MEASVPSSSSYAWRSIIHGRDVIKKGSVWRIGNGKSARIWGDNWLPSRHQPQIISPCLQAEQDMRVTLLIDQENRGWRDELLNRYFSDFEAELIWTIPICRFEQDDTLIWPHTPNGEYIVKSGYSFLQTEAQQHLPGPSDPGMIKPRWQAIWRMNVQSKIKNLVWRVCRDTLPSKQNLVKRKILTDATCDICQSEVEDGVHALFKCPKISALWEQVPVWKVDGLKRCPNFIDLLGCIFAENRDPELFSTVVWFLWNQRNNLRLSKGSIPLDQVLQQARNKL